MKHWGFRVSVGLGIVALASTGAAGMVANAAVVDGTIQVGDGHDTGYGPDSLDPDSSGGYELTGPVFSGSRDSFDQGLNSGKGGDVTTNDAIAIDKSADIDPATGAGTITLSVSAKPVPFVYNPPPAMDYVFVLDITSSMLQPYRGVTTESNWQAFWDDRARNYQMREAVKQAAAAIWASNPESTVTIVPFANSVLKPNRTGAGFTYGSFAPSGSTVTTGGATADPAILSHIHIPASGPMSLPANYSGTAANKAMTDPYGYYQVTEASGGATFSDSIDALPLASNTNTNAGLAEALDILKTGGLSATQQDNRVVVLITDGGANVAAGATAEAYFGQAAKDVAATSAMIKDPAQGNATVSVISIAPVPIVFDTAGEIFEAPAGNDGTYAVYSSFDRSGVVEWTAATANIPPGIAKSQPDGVGSVLDVQNGEYGMATAWASSPARYYGADEAGTAIGDVTKAAICESIDIARGYQASLEDALNTDAFDMDMSAEPIVTVSIDGGPALQAGDPGYPDSLVVTRTASGAHVDLGVVPYGDLLTPTSSTVVTITYAVTLKTDLGAHYPKIHTNIDDQTYLTVVPPRHAVASSGDVEYADSAFYLPFPTPVIGLLHDDGAPRVTLVKTDQDGARIDGAAFTVAATGKRTTTVAPLADKTDQFVLDADVPYTFTETTAPSGYTGIAAPASVTFSAADGAWSLTGPEEGVSLVPDADDQARATLTIVNAKKTTPSPSSSTAAPTPSPSTPQPGPSGSTPPSSSTPATPPNAPQGGSPTASPSDGSLPLTGGTPPSSALPTTGAANIPYIGIAAATVTLCGLVLLVRRRQLR